LGILRQITPAQLAEIERRLEAVGDRGLEAPGKSAATFDTSGIPDGTMIECVPMFVDVIAAHIRSDGETLNEVGRRRQKQQSGFKFRSEHHLCSESRRGGCNGNDGS
jgi:hypothetical protein